MLKVLRRWWAYITAKLGISLEERADPKVQLEQAIQEAQDQHRRLKEQAANVIAHQKQTEMRLNRAMADLEKVNANARQAVLMAEQAAQAGDHAKAAEYTATAESFANRLIALEREVEDLKALHLQSTEAANQAKAAVQQNATALQQKLAERQKLLSQLDQAKMQEQMNTAMASLSEAVGQDVPTLDEVRQKIEARYARAKGMAELTESSVESRMLEVEQAALNTEAQARLAQIREQLGIGPGSSTTSDAPAARAGGASGPPSGPGPGRPRAPGARRRGPTRRSASGRTPTRGRTTPASTRSCWPAVTVATSSTATATGRSRPSSPTWTPGGTRSTWPSRTGATTSTSARSSATPTPSWPRRCTSSGAGAGTGGGRW